MARTAGLVLGACALAVLTASSLLARQENTAAVLRQINSHRPSGLKLSYDGPLYTGHGSWQAGAADNFLEDEDKIQQLSAGIGVHTPRHPVHAQRQHRERAAARGAAQAQHAAAPEPAAPQQGDRDMGEIAAKAAAHQRTAAPAAAAAGGRAAAVAAARAAGLVVRGGQQKHAAAAGWLSTDPLVEEGVKSASRSVGSVLGMLGRAAAPVGRMLGRAADKGSELGGEISEGFEKTWDVHDVRVQPPKPVKMLTHV